MPLVSSPPPSVPSETAQILPSLPVLCPAPSPMTLSVLMLVWPGSGLGTDTVHRDAEMWERLADELLLLMCWGDQPVSTKRDSLPGHNMGSLRCTG